LAGEKICKPELDLIGKPFSVAYHVNFWELLTSLCVCVCGCHTRGWWFFDSESFKYPGLMVLWFWKFQIPRADGSLILKVSNTQGWWFFDSESFKYPELMVLWFGSFFFFKNLKPARLLQIKYPRNTRNFLITK
jgi:hypothetical protein